MGVHFPHSLLLTVALATSASGCAFGTRAFTMLGRSFGPLLSTPASVADRVTDPTRPSREGVRLSVLWVGHATALVQIDDKYILTDPVFTDTVGQLSKRLVEPGLDPANLPPIDAVLISHMHFDHLSLGSLQMIEKKVKRLLVPQGGLVYLPSSLGFESDELERWRTQDLGGGLKVTATPVQHLPWRYIEDRGWMTTSFTGYVVEYHGVKVYFGGDTAYHPEYFKETGKRFPGIEVALMPIAPIEPRDFMKRVHVDGAEAIRAFRDLGAKQMVPVHYDTFVNSLDKPGDALMSLGIAMKDAGVSERQVAVVRIGEQRVFIRR